MNISKVISLAISSIIFLAAILVLVPPVPADIDTPLPDGAFTIVVIPDTQHMTYTAYRRLILLNMTQWIVDNQEEYNIQFVTHVGDIVEDGSSDEWIAMNNSMMKLYDADIPYGFCAGNHDDGSAWHGDEYTAFDPDTLEVTKSDYWGGDVDSGMSNYQLLNISGNEFIFIHLCFEEPSFTWINGLLSTYSDRKAIITTHSLIDIDGSYGGPYSDEGWCSDFCDDVVSPNSNVGIVICGHNRGGQVAYHDVTYGGRTVYEVLYDWQGICNGGDGWMGLLTFYPHNDTIAFNSFSPYLAGTAWDGANQWNNDYNLVYPANDVNDGNSSRTKYTNDPETEEGFYYDRIISYDMDYTEDPGPGPDPSDVTMWFVSDVHVAADSHPETDGDFWDSINDTESIGADYAFIAGDLIYETPGTSSDWNDFHTIWDELDQITYKNYTIGNHDCNWETYSRLPNINYTYTIGNVLIIAIGDEDTSSSWGDGYYTNQLTWLNSTVQANSDKNIIILSHHPIDNTTYYTATPVKPIDDYQNFIEYIENSGSYHIDAWLSGHHHLTKDGTYDVIMEKNDIVFANIASIATWGTHPSDYPESTYWNFTEGSTQVKVMAYNHDTNQFYDNSEFPYYFNLTYDFTEVELAFNSINNVGNGSIVQENHRYFNWSKDPGATKYRLQISNSSDFSTTFIDFDNITEGCDFESMEGGSYTEVGNYVEFSLPYAYNITDYGYDYYRVKAYTTS